MALTVTPVSEHVGAEVGGVDLAHLSDADVSSILTAWHEHGVLFFRGQDVSPEGHIAFAERLAPIDVNKFFTPVDGYPRIAQVLKEPDQQGNIGGGWHTDHTYDDVPAKGSILVARDVPATGGDTRFTHVGAAFDLLSDGLRETLLGMRAHHTNEHVFGQEALHARQVGDRLGNSDLVGGAEHPVVVAHPSTGRPLLYVNPAFTTHFVGWTVEESKPLLDFLFQHIAAEDRAYDFSWEPGSVAMWDNRSTWHWALNDYQGQRRLMHRITLGGEPLGVAS